MALKRTTVFADEDDLAVLRAAARRVGGVAEAELIRDAIHLAAMSDRLWEEPFFSRTYEPVDRPSDSGSAAGGPGASGPAAATDDVWADAVAAYERTRSRPR